MINLKNYYDFFARHKFDSKEVVVSFMTNGWFAVAKYQLETKGRYVRIYDENANLRLEFDGPGSIYVLCKTGCVVVRDFKRSGFIVYYQDKEINFFYFPDIGLTSVSSIENASLLISKGDIYKGVLITKSCGGIASNLIQIDSCASVCSADDLGNLAYSSKNCVYILNVNNNIFELPYVETILFMADKRAIIRYKDLSCALICYDKNALPTEISKELQDDVSLKNHVELAYSVHKNSIMSLSRYKTIFEDALIMDLNGNIFSEYDKSNKIITVTKNGCIVKPYTIEYQEKKGYYPASLGKLFEINGDTLFVFYYNKRFYPILIDNIPHLSNEMFLKGDMFDFEYRRVLKQVCAM